MKSIVHLLIMSFILIKCNALSYDSQTEYEQNTNNNATYLSYIADAKWCVGLVNGKNKLLSPLEVPDFNNTYIPPVLGQDSRPMSNQTSEVTKIALAASLRAYIYTNLVIAGLFSGVSGFTAIAFAALAAEYLTMSDVCTNAYIMMPNEYINVLKSGDFVSIGTDNDGKVANVGKSALSQDQVPFYYTCNPNYDPTTPDNKVANPANIGRVWGYQGAASPFCVGNAKDYAIENLPDAPNLIGKVRIEYRPWYERFFSLSSPAYNRFTMADKDGGYADFIGAGEEKRLGLMHFYAYYHFDTTSSKVQICVATPYTMIPIKVGCSYVAPPAENLVIPPYLEEYMADTRCAYFLTGRTDLQSFGKALEEVDSTGHSGVAMKGFLQSDFHITSTVVGCIKDLLIKVFLNPSSLNLSAGQGLFIEVQQRFQQIVFAVLILYVSLIGIKIMSSPQVPKIGEFMMFIIKFALVVYFITPQPWYDKTDRTGLFPTLLFASDDIANFFLQAQNDNDPIGLCKYNYQGSELLTERSVPLISTTNADSSSVGGISQSEATVGQSGVKFTVWDLVDCKVTNYLTLGSCQYSLSGIVGFWFGTACLLVKGIGILAAIVTFIYSFMLLLVIFKFVHITILSAFVIAVLVLVSPIFICFSLFEATKSIFQQWMKMLLGYVLYPALLFAYIALMLVTFDSVFFGSVKVPSGSTGNEIVQACKGVDSVYCTTALTLGANPCAVNVSKLPKELTETLDLGPLGSYTRIKVEYVNDYFQEILKLMFYAVLFYFFSGSVINFLEIITGVQGLGELSKGSINITTPVKFAGEQALTQGSNLIGKGIGGIKGAFTKSSGN